MFVAVELGSWEIVCNAPVGGVGYRMKSPQALCQGFVHGRLYKASERVEKVKEKVGVQVG